MEKFDYSVEVVLNTLSIGQVSRCILQELHKAGHEPSIFIISNNFDLSAEDEIDDDFVKWCKSGVAKANHSYSRKNPCLKIWHINGSHSSVSDNQSLFSFYELDNPTDSEINICRNQSNVIFSSQDSCDLFAKHDVNTKYVPLGFDSDYFKVVDKTFFLDDRIVFGLAGKFEKRKNHLLTIDSWAEAFGNNKDYYLSCALHNPFLSQEDHLKIKQRYSNYWNIQINDRFPKNQQYNDYLNSIDIMLCPSGGEGWGLPEFQATALGAHAVVLNCSAYKGWANQDNAVLFEPLEEKIPANDGKFFVDGGPFNQGKLYTFAKETLISACEEAVARHKSNKVNEAGLKLQSDFTYTKTAEKCINIIREI
tara:strand:+ start:1987 stop:3081 length:1095 start_codon:yes stop_codon:yes gene_type:complete